MASDYDGKQDRRSDSRAKLENLVQSRTETLSRFTDLVNQRPFEAEPELAESVQQFCEALIDYTASAHFQLYRFLEESKERRKPVAEIADGVYPQIVRTTDAILAFNDKYEKAELVNGAVDHLSDDLSLLGEALADRIQLEDKVIGALTGQPVH